MFTYGNTNVEGNAGSAHFHSYLQTFQHEIVDNWGSEKEFANGSRTSKTSSLCRILTRLGKMKRELKNGDWVV